MKEKDAMQVLRTLEESKDAKEDLVTKLPMGMYKRSFEEFGWHYDFYFAGGKLKKVESYNHREFNETWIK